MSPAMSAMAPKRGTSRPATMMKMKYGMSADAIQYAGDITGDLLIVHGELDTGVHIHSAWRLLDKLISAGREPDVLFVPGDGHEFKRHGDYVERRQLAWLQEHLVKNTPSIG